MNRVRVVIIDDHEVVRHGLKLMLDADPELTVVAEAGTVSEAIDVVSRLEADLFLVDVRLPDGDGIALCRSIHERHPAARCAVLSSSDDPSDVERARRAGATAYLLKGTPQAALLASIKRAGAEDTGEFPQLRRTFQGVSLTESERAILTLLGEGLSNAQIGAIVNLSPKTVANYASALYAKLGLAGRVHTTTATATRVAWATRDFA